MNEHRVVLPIKEAKRIDAKHYYAFKACKNGHYGPRRIKGGCCQCNSDSSKNRYKASPYEMKVAGSKAMAKIRNLEHTITADDIEWGDVCPVYGIPIDYNADKYSNNAPQLDRVDNSKGYIKGNVKVISRKANVDKRDLSIDEVRKLLRYMESS